MKIKNVTLEMSLKPFRCLDDEYIEKVCHKMFVQWRSLTDKADIISVLLWVADGSEILEYSGNLADEIEWAKYVGGANPKGPIPNDPDGRALHSRSYLYCENPPTITYNDLKRIISAIKKIGSEITGKPIRIGETFDPGPEFAKSPFKYKDHPEICLADTMGENQNNFVTCYAKLHADAKQYAGFPSGIEEATPFGKFMGRQCELFLTEMGFDYIWFSNGFGFGKETWYTTGELFDGAKFYSQRVDQTVKNIREFWLSFRSECPDFPIETRGTNLSYGIDIASDGTDYDWLLNANLNYSPSPNSPWAALNGDFGLELMGYMSRIAELPKDVADGFPFRFYTHDPWWLNSPWLDRYNRQPHDIYLPMSVSRVDENGEIETPSSIQFLTVDDSFGQMPEEVPNEVIPHILTAVNDSPDQAGPFVWVYPFDQYHQTALKNQKDLTWPFFGDWFIRGAINTGLPLNTVVSDKNFISIDPNKLSGSILIVPLPHRGAEIVTALIDFIEHDVKVIFYGPSQDADERILELLKISNKNSAISGEMKISLADEYKNFDSYDFSTNIKHNELTSTGPCCETLSNNDKSIKTIATYSSNKTERVAAMVRRLSNTKIAWIRGTVSAEVTPGILVAFNSEKYFLAESLVRITLAEFGWSIQMQNELPSQSAIMSCIARKRNAFYISAHSKDTTVDLKLSTPFGAPVFTGYDVKLVGGQSEYHIPRTLHEECRVFIDEQTDGIIKCTEIYSGEMGISRRIGLTGLKKATIRFFVETNISDDTSPQQKLTFRPANLLYDDAHIIPHKLIKSPDGIIAEVKNIDSDIVISW